jgi:hypothetical protein
MKRLFLAALALASAACASTPMPAPIAATPGPTAGFAEEKISSTRYRISYTAPATAPQNEISSRLLARAAQLTLEKGNDWFEIASRIDGKNTEALVIVMGQGEALAGGAAKTYDAKATLAAAKSKPRSG